MTPDRSQPRPGDEHLSAFSEDFHDRLASYWPEPREQLHIGGWQATYALASLLHFEQADHILDVCCGEGATAIWTARNYDAYVVGLDIVPSAIESAVRNASGFPGIHFVVGNVFYLPFAVSSFDIVFGQDPDGYADHRRLLAFQECFRVLRSGGKFGFQHWLLHNVHEERVRSEFDRINAELGFGWMSRLSDTDYVQDLREAGFVNIRVESMSETYRNHMDHIERIRNEKGLETDKWTQKVLDIMRSGYQIGVRILADKPSA